MSSLSQLWLRFQRYYSTYPSIGLSLDLSRMNFPDDFFHQMAQPIAKAFAAMDALEKGAIANPDENRMVGHYWLRNSSLAPTPEIRADIDHTIARIKTFASDVHTGKIAGAAGPFTHLLLIGIGGSALGPQFVSHALGHPKTDKLKLHFIDNTDPDGMHRVFAEIGRVATPLATEMGRVATPLATPQASSIDPGRVATPFATAPFATALGRTLCLVISKSGATKETRNGMLEAQAAWQLAGLKFSQHAVAITAQGSALDQLAQQQHWLARFPMWDWVGGRTSQTSAVGLLPAALQGIDIDQFLAGAAACDQITRQPDIKTNPAAQLALMWHYATAGHGRKHMVVLPYSDRLELLSRYLQQLVMESLGKERDLDGNLVNQGLTVYGNKGSTDQHAYIQQLRDGLHNFFAIFIQVLESHHDSHASHQSHQSHPPPLEVEPQVTSGDYLFGFFMGTRQALFENGRESVTLTLTSLSPASIGGIIALFERTVGLYASYVNVNAYHQPGVEAGKKAAENIITIQRKLLSIVSRTPATSSDLATQLDVQNPEIIFKLCERLAANGRLIKHPAPNPFETRYSLGDPRGFPLPSDGRGPG